MIEVRGLTRRFGEVTAVRDLDLAVRSGECFGLLGPNGAGKTTTVRVLCALIAPSSGSVRVAGIDLGDAGAGERIRGSIGLLPEHPGLYESLTARENLAFYAELFGLSPESSKERVQGLLELLGLEKAADRATATFSKGMKQKVALARALLHQPKALFLDEPTSGLDPFSARVVKDVLLGLKKAGTTIFLSTHNLPEAEELCDRVGVLRQRLLAEGTPQQLARRSSERRGRFRWRSGFRPELARLQAIEGVGAIEVEPEGMRVTLADPTTQLPGLVEEIVREGARVTYAAEEVPSLEEAYLRIIGGPP